MSIPTLIAEIDALLPIPVEVNGKALDVLDIDKVNEILKKYREATP